MARPGATDWWAQGRAARARYAGVSGPETVRLGLEIAARAGPPATPARRTPATVAQPSPRCRT